MLIEAAKGGHTNVVQLLLDYPELVNSNNSDSNANVAVSSAASINPGSTITSTTATATQTGSVPTSIPVETPKSNTTSGEFRINVLLKILGFHLS